MVNIYILPGQLPVLYFDMTIIYYVHILTQFYSGGVYNSIKCSRTSLNHAMLVTGYGTYKGKEYYLVKNRYSCMCIQLATH